jgi:hypothetical protein
MTREDILHNCQNGEVIGSELPRSWAEVFAALDQASIPADFLEDRGQEVPQVREEPRGPSSTTQP